MLLLLAFVFVLFSVVTRCFYPAGSPPGDARHLMCFHRSEGVVPGKQVEQGSDAGWQETELGKDEEDACPFYHKISQIS